MTNEEAIAVFEEFKVIDDWTMVHLPPMEDAINMAIEALKDVQNCVHCEHYTEIETDTGIEGECKMDTAHKVSEVPTGSDLISRQDAIDALQCEWCVEKINNLPSVEPKTGKWIILDECANDGVYCSRCHKKVFNIDYSNTMKWKSFNYCPNCGADMRGEEE